MGIKKVTSIPEIDAIIASMSKKFGKEFISNGPKYDAATPLSTGSAMLDTFIGIGGIPLDRIIEIFGPESSGKTSLCLQLVAKYQQTYDRPVVVFDVERSLSEHFMKGIGVDVSKMIFVYPDTAEEALETILAFNKSGSVGLILVDSVDGLQNSQWLKKSIGDADMQGIAKLMGQALRQISKLCIENKVTNIFINQIRDSLNMYGPKSTTPGGKALKFYASLRLELMKGKPSPNLPEALLIRVKQVKNKVASPKVTVCELDFAYGKGINQYYDLLSLAKSLGYIRYAGSTVRITLNGEEKTLCTGGKAGAYQHLENNPDIFQQLYQTCIEIPISEPLTEMDITDDNQPQVQAVT